MTAPAVIVELELGALGRLAELVAEKLDARQHARFGRVTAEVVAAHLDVEVGYVYADANELDACTVGAGPKPRKRFPLDREDGCWGNWTFLPGLLPTAGRAASLSAAVCPISWGAIR